MVGKVHPPIEDLRIVPIRESEEEPKVIFLIDVPHSNNSPHMATPYNKYFKRLNFENLPMGHYEVHNLFKINWIMKEKLIEKIYEPLAKELRRHIDELEEYSCPSTREVEVIISNIYYVNRLPSTVFDQIHNYVDEVEDLYKKEYYARTAIRQIIARNVSKYLGKVYDQGNEKIDIKFKAIADDYSSIDLYDQQIHKLLLKNQRIKQYLSDKYFEHVYIEITILYNNEPHRIDLEKFDESIWKKCSEEASENFEINQMKKSIETLLTEAWDLIDEISKY
ncbi:MAG: hypothetical protein H3Z52_07665 [archaeon]|nr:hypothetical protein [archaeon]